MIQLRFLSCLAMLLALGCTTSPGLVAFDARDGTELWRRDRVLAVGLASENALLILERDRVAVVNTTTGSYQPIPDLLPRPTTPRELLHARLVGTPDGLARVSLDPPTADWIAPIDGRLFCAALDGARAWIVDESGLRSLQLGDGQLSAPLPEFDLAPASVRSVHAAGSLLVVCTYERIVRVVDPGDGSLRWEDEGHGFLPPIVRPSGLLFADQDARLQWFPEPVSEPAWTLDLPIDLIAVEGIDEHWLAGGRGGWIWSIRADDGQREWSSAAGGDEARPLPSAGEPLVLVDRVGVLRLDGTGEVGNRWPTDQSITSAAYGPEAIYVRESSGSLVAIEPGELTPIWRTWQSVRGIDQALVVMPGRAYLLDSR